MKQSKEYNVVFEYTCRAGAYSKGRKWGSWDSKECFMKEWNTLPVEQRELRIIIAEGVTADEASRLCEATPLKTLYAIAFERAIDNNTLEVDELVLQDGLLEAAIVKGVVI